MTPTINSAPVVQFKSRSINIPTLFVYSNNMDLIALSFKEQLAKTNLFKNASIILDISHIEGSLNVEKLLTICHELSLFPIAVQGNEDATILNAFKSFNISSLSTTKENHNEIEHETIITRTVRSGQQIYSEKPLIIIGDVSAAAEVMSDASIHIYGELRGKAMAGVRGDTNTHIFAKSSQAELIAIGKQFVLSEQSKSLNFVKPSRFSIMDKKIKVFSL